MANFSVMADIPNPVFDSNGNPFSGAVLKAYLPGTTTSTSIAIDENGASPQASITYNAAGKLEVSGNEILPYIDIKHKWGIFANSVDAAANTPFYMGSFDDVPKPVDATGVENQIINDLSQAYEFATVAAYKAFATSFPVGKVIHLLDRGAEFTVIAGTGTANTFNIIASDQVVQSISLENTGMVKLKQYGAVGDGVTDDSDAFQAAWIDATTQLSTTYDNTNRGLDLGQGIYIITRNNFLNDTGQAGVVLRRSVIKGYGANVSVIIFRPTVAGAYMYDQRVAPNNAFNGLVFKNMGLRFKDDNNGGGDIHGFFSFGQPGSASQKFTFDTLFCTLRPNSNWFTAGGTVNDDLSNYIDCVFNTLKTLILLKNSESVIHKIINTDLSLVSGHCFVIEEGGMISYKNGSVVMETGVVSENGLLWLGGDPSSAPNAGTIHKFENIRMELRSSLSRVLYCIHKLVRQTVTFQSCNFGNTSTTNSFAILPVANQSTIIFDTCALPQSQAVKFSFIDNPTPLTEYVTANAIDSTVKFKNCRRFSGAVEDAEYYADFSAVTYSDTQQGQTVVYEGNRGLPNIMQYGNRFGTAMSYNQAPGSLVQFRGWSFPWTSDGVTATNTGQYFNLVVPGKGLVVNIVVTRNTWPSGGVPVIWELVDGVEFVTPTTGVIYGESPSQNLNDEWNWETRVNTRIDGTIAERTIWLRQKPSNITVPITATNSEIGGVYATVI